MANYCTVKALLCIDLSDRKPLIWNRFSQVEDWNIMYNMQALGVTQQDFCHKLMKKWTTRITNESVHVFKAILHVASPSTNSHHVIYIAESSYKVDYIILPYIHCLSYRTTPRFDFLYSFMACAHYLVCMLFRYIGRLVTNQQKILSAFSAWHWRFYWLLILLKFWNFRILLALLTENSVDRP